jgi:phosphohistidine phosphatase
MELILWRHAEAEDGMPDSARQLTHKGEKQAAKMAAFLHARMPAGSRILVSPTKRTQQTALALAGNFETEPEIAPGAAPRALLKAAGWPEENGCVLVVGHQPALGEVAAHLMGCPGAGFNIKKGAVWWFRSRNGEADLRLAIAPDSL